ncbi:MAG: valine--tRNA ligase [Bdellovibrionales bacterium]|nr:valine--tRNA ligase [Bdellovibrionales bacterium]
MANTGKTFKKVEGIDFASLPKNLEFPKVEAVLQERWGVEGTYRFQENDPRPVFAVDTPPPTVSGSLHVGHIFSYTQTDILARYQRMKGKNVFYPMGWDDNGLPTERRVQNFFHIRCEANEPYVAGLDLPPILSTMTEKEFEAKKLPQRNLSRKNFIEHCHKLTHEDEKLFKKLWSHIGLSVDWSLEYATIDDHSRKIAQLSFLDLHSKKELYQVEAPTLWDTDFQTAVAQAELEDREIPGAFHDIEFQVEGGGSFTIATTRPELLPACVGITTHPSDERYKKFIGKRAISPLFGISVPIFGSELVNPEKGTGILMVCTFGDQTDVQWWREQKLPLRQIIGRDGRLQAVNFASDQYPSKNAEAAAAHYQIIVGKTVKQAQKAIVEILQANGFLKNPPKPIQHAVKFYEKGDRPVEILTTRQWFVKLVDKKEKIIEYGSKIQWHPEFMYSRFKNWTENLSIDWCISRQRFFGVSIPVWYALDQNGVIDHTRPILPAKENLPVDPMSDVPAGFTESQRGKPGGFIGESDVFDTWFTSSLTPQLGSHWEVNPARHRKLFPMDVRPQSHEIIRTWAFYTIAKAMLHEEKIPWKHIVISGWVLDPDRKKMSKSKGNVVTPSQFLEEHGADAVRYWAGLARYGVDTAFDPGIMKIGRRLAMKLFNAGKFVLSQSAVEGGVSEPLDLAFLAKLKKAVLEANRAFEDFEPAQALMETEKFFWSHFTDSYLELVKGRTWGEKTTAEELRAKASAVHALRLGLKTFLKIFAPFLPYTTEEVWSYGFQGESKSIHHASYPEAADFDGIPAGDPAVFDAAMAAQSVINQQKTVSKVSIARPVVKVMLKAHPKTIESFLPASRDVMSASKVEHIDWIRDEALAANEFRVESIEYGPEPLKS